MKFSTLFLGVVILSVALGGLAGGWERNQAALEMAGACLRNSAVGSDTEVLGKQNLVWFAAVQAKCGGDSEKEKSALIKSLASTEARLDVIRAMMPEEIDLAALAAETYPINSQAQFWYGNLLAGQMKTAEAIESYERGLKHKPLDGVAWVFLGGLYESTGDWRAALPAYDKGCSYFDRGGNGCPNAGRIFLEQGFYELAANRYQKSLQQIPTFYGPSEYGLAMALIALERPHEALPHLQALAERGDGRAVKMLAELGVISDR